MKFSNGQWLERKDVTLYCPSEVNDLKVEQDSITVFAPYKPVRDRGDTLNAAMITVRFSSPGEDIIRVQIYHHKGFRKKTPEFEINSTSYIKAAIENNTHKATLTSGKLAVNIKKKDGWEIDYLYDNKRITGSGRKNVAFLTTDYGNGEVYMREQLSLAVGEYVYGLGERFTSFIKNGQVVDIWNEDGGTCSEQSYKNIPFYITNKGYGVFVNHPERVSFEVASEKVNKVQFSVPGQYLEYFIIGGDSLKQVLRNYTALTGRPSLPPAWSFGLWLTTSFTTSYDENTVNSFIDGMIKRDIPLRVFHFDCFWMKEFQWCDFEWDREVFPDPEGMLGRLKDKGLKICMWINPYIAQKSALFDEGMEKGYLLKKPNGDVWQWDMWQAGMGLVDFTNPQAAEWYKSKLKKLLDMGVDCFKTDFGERIPVDVQYHDGSDPFRMHNYYTYLYNKAVFELLEDTHGKNEAMLFARSATVGGQKFPVHWGGDCTANYESMAESLRGGLSLCLSGFGFWSHDISGFESTATPDVYKRWSAFGLLSTHSRLHGSESYRVPWLFDEEAVDVVRYFTKLKCSLMPYLYSAACEASNEGIPMMRAMLLEFPDDPTCNFLELQYMLGDSLLVAPIFNENGDVSYYLPQGTWTNFITGDKVEGACWRHENHGYQSIPLMVKPNSIIAVGGVDNKPDYDYADNVEFHLFELYKDQEASTVVYDTSGKPEITVKAVRNRDSSQEYREYKDSEHKDSIEFVVQGAKKPWKLILRGIDSVSTVSGGSYEKGDKGIVIIPDSYSSKLAIELE